MAFIACLGLAQLSHETTPAVAQLAFAALLFYGFAALPYRTYGPHLAIALGTVGLALSGAPGLGLLWCLGGTALRAWSKVTPDDMGKAVRRRYASSLALLGYALVAGGLAWWLELWRWRIALPPLTWGTLDGFVQLLVWFTWPAWPLALWTLWRWRHQWLNRSPQRHLAWPLAFAVVTVIASFLGGDSDRTLLLALPALAALAAFALPTLKRQVSALIDWFTLLFFSGCGFTIWVVWIAMQTGVPEPTCGQRGTARAWLCRKFFHGELGRGHSGNCSVGAGWCIGASAATGPPSGKVWCCRPAVPPCAGCS